MNSYLLVTDRGLKERGVTKSHPGLVLACEPIRKKIFRSLQKDKRFRTVSAGDRRKAIEEMELIYHGKKFLRSADLTKASDLIPFELAFALLSGFSKRLSNQDKVLCA